MRSGGVCIQVDPYGDAPALRWRLSMLPSSCREKVAERLSFQAQKLTELVTRAVTRDWATITKLTIEVGEEELLPSEEPHWRGIPFAVIDLIVAGRQSRVPVKWQHSGGDIQARVIEEFATDVRAEIHAAVHSSFLEEREEVSLILLPFVACQLLHECIGHTLEGDNALDYGLAAGFVLGSRLSDYPLSVFDDPRLPNMRGSYIVDQEGNPARRAALLEDGVVGDYLADSATAPLLGCKPGSARRVDRNHPPLPRMSNLWAGPGNQGMPDLLAQVKRGLLCVGTWGGGSSGFQCIVRPAFGQWIEGGRLTGRFVRRFDILGRKDLLIRNIVAASNEVKWFSPHFGCDKKGQNNLPVSFGSPALLLGRAMISPVALTRQETVP